MVAVAQDSVGSAHATASRMLEQKVGDRSKADLKSTFQDVVAGTFYKEMLKSFRKMHTKSAYFHGGQAEEIFQGQMDQQVAEDLAHGDGGGFSESLYQAFIKTGRV